jgi:ATP-dependent DNA helicase RecG
MTKDEFIARLKKPEWSDLECKKSQHGISEDAYRTVSAFANTCGGMLVFGVKDSQGRLEIVGVSEPDKVQNDFLSALRTGDKLNRRITVKEERFEHDGKLLLVFHIPEALRSEKPVYLKGDIRQSYIRRGAGDEQCTQTEIERFLRDAAADRYDSQTVEYDPNTCFDHSSLAWYRSRYESRPNNRSYAGATDSEFLFQLGLIRETPQGRKPSHAAILLFGSDGYLRGIMPRPVADCQRFGFPYGENPPGVRWLDRVVMESNIIQAWLAFLNWYMKFASVPFRLDPMTMERDDTPPDFVAFRESFVNVLCHQDYQDHTRKPEIRHFTDRTIFWNPGDAFAIGDLLEPGPKEVRNPNIAIAFRRIGFSENAGWGLNDVIANWTKLGHTPPIIKNGKASKDFEVTLMALNTADAHTGQVTGQVEAHDEAQVTHQVTHQVTGQVAGQVAGQVTEQSESGAESGAE